MRVKSQIQYTKKGNVLVWISYRFQFRFKLIIEPFSHYLSPFCDVIFNKLVPSRSFIVTI